MQTPAVIFAEPRHVQFGEIDMPAPGPDEVQVRTEYSTISAGTEGWVLKSQFSWSESRFPGVPGYQRVGRIEKLGGNVTGFEIGQRVVATVGRWTGDVIPQWGSHVLVGNTQASEIYPAPVEADPIDLSAVVVAQVGYNAASRISLTPGAWVAVYGDGLIGQFAAQAAKARGARVLLVGHRQERLDIGHALGIDATVNSSASTVNDVVRAAIGEPTVTAIIDTVQTPAAQAEYMPLLAHGSGQIVYSGFTPGEAWANMAVLQQQELSVHFVSGWNRNRMLATIDLIARGRIKTRPLVTHLVTPDHAPAMYDAILTRGSSLLGVTIDWTKL